MAGLLFFIYSWSWGQQTGVYQITWHAAQTGPQVKTKQRLSFEDVWYTSDNVPLYKIEIPGAFKNIRVVPLETEAIESRDRFILPSSIAAPLSEVTFYKGRPVTVIIFTPLLIGATGSMDKIKRFKIESEEELVNIPSRTLIKSSRNSALRSGRTQAATGSVLASGIWYKFPVTSTGIHKIDYAYLQSLGINPSTLNPDQIRIFGNGGGMLPQLNSAPRYDDLFENSIEVIGGGDGTFDQGDYILFYARGPHQWTYNATTFLYEHEYNLYSDQAYYFLNIGSSNGLRIGSKNSLGSAAQSFDYFDERRFHESDLYSIIKSGRYWYGELFGEVMTREFSFDWSNARPGSDIKLNVAVLGRSLVNTSFSVRLNGTTLSPINVGPLATFSYPPRGIPVTGNYTVSVASLGSFSTATVSLSFNNGGTFASRAHLDYLTIQGQRSLRLYGNQTAFRCAASIDQPTSEYRIQNASTSLRIWDVSNHLDPVQVNYTIAGSEAVFSDNSDVLREYVCFSGSNFPSPGSGAMISNQNLHAVDAPYLPDMVIVTHPSLKSEADRLAVHRKNTDGLDVLVVTTEQVYNEFSSGAQDVTAIRDFMKMLYDRNTATDSVRYLLLFGDCSYDYKNRVANNTNMVPCYQSRNSLEELRSYSSEDYFGFMDDAEGNWGEISVESHKMEIGVGRIPAINITQAAAMVNKIIQYQKSTETQSKWKNRITVVSDDGDLNTHIQDAEHMASRIQLKDPRYNLNKIHLDAYPQETAAGGEKSPIVSNLIDRDIERGTFVLNYSGHGGTGVWAQEQILTLPQVDNWQNQYKLPLVVTATCDFGRYDDPTGRTGTDAVLFNPIGGGIAMITSTRVVFAFSNRTLNEKIYDYLFQSYSTDFFPRMGDVFKLTKNNSTVDVFNRNFTYLGDPSMHLAYPRNNMVVTHMNETPVSAIADTIKALSKVTIEGEIRNESNVLLSGYSGTAFITCFDKENTMVTYGNQNPPYTFTLLNNFFFEGKASITGGKFKVVFIAPKDISFQFDQGKISLYARHAQSMNDAAGYYDNVQVGGTNTAAPDDNKPPLVELYMNDESFVSGGLTNSSPLLLAKVSDENGINVGTGGIGHEITSVFSHKSDVLILNEYYSTELDDYTKGVVRYPVKNLSPGNYSVRFKAWDTYNNSSEGYLEFVVANTEKMALNHVLNYPNPFSTRTDFHFDHNRAGDDLEVLIQVYTVSGKMIKSMDQYIPMSPAHISGFIWDGRDDFGDKIGKGVYVYKVKVRSLRDGSTTHQYQKLVLLN